MARIALCMGLADSWEHGIARGVVRYARGRPEWRLHGYGWMFQPLESIERWDGDGIIARVESRADADRIAAVGVPVVDVAGAYLWAGFHRVTNDDVATGRLAAANLRSRGFRVFAYAGVKAVGWSEGRLAGFRETLGPAARELPRFEETLPWWEGSDPGALAAWIASLDRPVGVFACNDTAGLKLAEHARKARVKVPEEMAILGVDNEDILCELAVPTLSSIALDLEGIGYAAARLMGELIGRPARGKGARGIRTLRVPPIDAVERESTRVFTCPDPLVEAAVRVIRAAVTEPLGVSDVVRRLPASRRALEIRFRKAMGHSLLEEIQAGRIERAKGLLRGTDERIADIALDSGYRTPQRFHVVFRAAVGVTPARYRRLNRVATPRSREASP